jgi:sulfur-carrier protein
VSRVRIPGVLRGEVGDRRDVEIGGVTVGEVLTTLVATFPGLRDRLLIDGTIAPFVNVYIDGTAVEIVGGLSAPAQPNSVIVLLPAMAGG